MYPGYNMIINTILVFYAIKKLDADSSKQVRQEESHSAGSTTCSFQSEVCTARLTMTDHSPCSTHYLHRTSGLRGFFMPERAF